MPHYCQKCFQRPQNKFPSSCSLSITGTTPSASQGAKTAVECVLVETVSPWDRSTSFSSLGQASLQGVCHIVGAKRTGTGIREFCAPTLFSYFQTLRPWQILKLPKFYYSVK